MSARIRTYSKTLSLGVVLSAVWLAVCSSAALAEPPSANPSTMSFAAGGKIRMNLNVGSVEVVGGTEENIKVSWHSSRPEDEQEVSVKLEGSGTKEATLTMDGPGNRIEYLIEVPKQSNVNIDMNAGTLEVRGILGDIEANLLAGEMLLRVAEPSHYRTVSAAVTVGEIDAPPWQVDLGGFARSFKATNEGDSKVRASLLAGEITIRSE